MYTGEKDLVLNSSEIAIILLSTYNGSEFLEEQLQSLFAQTESFHLICRDDGSSDSTLEILETWANKYEQITLLKDPDQRNLGVILSFFSLLQFAKENTKAKYFFFCDQDDLWYPDKVSRSIQALIGAEKNKSNSTPILYHTDLDLISANGKYLNTTFWKKMHLDPEKSKQLNRILCQPTITGCSMAINRALVDRVEKIPDGAKMHDWWFGLIACSFGEIVSDHVSKIAYRQHDKNVIGTAGFTVKRLSHHLSNLNEYRKKWKEQNLSRIRQAEEFLEVFGTDLNKAQREVLNAFVQSKSLSFWRRKVLQFRYKFWQQAWYRKIVSFLLF